MKFWLRAFRPKTLSAAIVPIVVATALVAAQDMPIQWAISALALVAALFIQIATNLFNDAIDFKKGADQADRLGPQRATQSGWFTYKHVMGLGYLFVFLALLLGIPLVLRGGEVIVMIGLVSLLLAYGYTGGPFPLAYLGLGDLFVVLFFGLIAVGGVFFLHTLNFSEAVIIAGLQVGMLATVLIAINNIRDMYQDQRVGKKTLPVRFGLTFGRVEIAALIFISYLLQLYWLWLGLVWATLLPLIMLPLAVSIIFRVFKTEPGMAYNSLLAQAGVHHLLFGVLLSIGLWCAI